jgi:hypothetical protein
LQFLLDSWVVFRSSCCGWYFSVICSESFCQVLCWQWVHRFL